MKTFYRLVVSNPVDQPAQNLPFTVQRKFRSFNSARKSAQIHHKKKCSIVIVEINDGGMVNTWEVKGDCVFPESFLYIKDGQQFTKA